MTGAKPATRNIREKDKLNRKIAARAFTSIDLLDAPPVLPHSYLYSTENFSS
jgi:hypothetical protein